MVHHKSHSYISKKRTSATKRTHQKSAIQAEAATAPAPPPRPMWNCKLWPYVQLCKNYLFPWPGGASTGDEAPALKKRSTRRLSAKSPRYRVSQPFRCFSAKEKKLYCMLGMVKDMIDHVQVKRPCCYSPKRPRLIEINTGVDNPDAHYADDEDIDYVDDDDESNYTTYEDANRDEAEGDYAEALKGIASDDSIRMCSHYSRKRRHGTYRTPRKSKRVSFGSEYDSHNSHNEFPQYSYPEL